MFVDLRNESFRKIQSGVSAKEEGGERERKREKGRESTCNELASKSAPQNLFR